MRCCAWCGRAPIAWGLIYCRRECRMAAEMAQSEGSER